MRLACISNPFSFERLLEKEIIMSEFVTGASAAVVLVHGGFVDGSGWEDVYKILKKVSRPASCCCSTRLREGSPARSTRTPKVMS